jgi:hypothetical protein
MLFGVSQTDLVSFAGALAVGGRRDGRDVFSGTEWRESISWSRFDMSDRNTGFLGTSVSAERTFRCGDL